MTEYLKTWAERRDYRDGSHRSTDLESASSHLPPAPPRRVLEEDIHAMKAAHTVRFDEDLPRTETLMAVAAIGYRMALRDVLKNGGDE